MAEETKSRIESEIEVKSYIQDLKFALNNGAKIDFQAKRLVDEKRDEKYTNQYLVLCQDLVQVKMRFSSS